MDATNRITDEMSVNYHPVLGKLLGVSDSAKYLGISRKKFLKIRPRPDYVDGRSYSYWSIKTLNRLVDVVSAEEKFCYPNTLKKGRECGNYLLGELAAEEIAELRSKLISSKLGEADGCSVKQAIERVLREYGVPVEFKGEGEAKIYCDGILWAIKRHRLAAESAERQLTGSRQQNATAKSAQQREWDIIFDDARDHSEAVAAMERLMAEVRDRLKARGPNMSKKELKAADEELNTILSCLLTFRDDHELTPDLLSHLEALENAKDRTQHEINEFLEALW